MLRTYRCPEHNIFEHWQSNMGVLDKCPKCNKPVTQVLGLNFKLVGPGFYSTDNGGNNGSV